MKNIFRKFSYIILILMFATNIFGSRSSDDIVTVTNSLFNNYIHDVIGNKSDKTQANSLVGMVKKLEAISTNATGSLVIIISDGVTNEKLLRTNQNRLTIGQAQSLSNRGMNIRIEADTTAIEVDTISIQSDGVTNEKLIRTNQNRIDLIKVDTTAVLVDTVLIKSDGVTNEKLIRTNQNRIDLIQVDTTAILVDTVLIKSDGVTNEKILKTNQNRLSLIQSDGVTNETLLRANQTKISTIIDHIHKPMDVYPTLATGITINATGTAWTLTNNYTNVVVPAATITSDFDIHAISIEDISANGVYELVLYNMTTPAELGRIRFTKNAAQDATLNVSIGSAIVLANAKIGARLASSGGANETVVISIHYQLE